MSDGRVAREPLTLCAGVGRAVTEVADELEFRSDVMGENREGLCGV